MDWLDRLCCVFAFLIVVCIGGLIYAVVVDHKDPHILLDKSDWSCTHSHTIIVPTVIGKAVMMVPEDICDTYRMNGY